MHHHRPVELFRQVSFVRRSEITAPFKSILELALLVRGLQHLHRIVVLKPRKRRLDYFQLRYVALELGQFLAPILQHTPDDERDELFGETHHVVQICECDFRLDHPELRQVTARL